MARPNREYPTEWTWYDPDQDDGDNVRAEDPEKQADPEILLTPLARMPYISEVAK